MLRPTVVLIAAAVLLTGCSGVMPAAAPPSSPAVSATASAPVASSTATFVPAPTPTATPTPTASSTPAPTVAAATADMTPVDAGTVTNTKSTSAKGTGPAAINITSKGDFGTVVKLDCSKCSGPVTLTEAGRMTPHGEGTAPMSGEYVVRVLVNDPAQQTLLLTATGPWKVTFLSWNTLPVHTGKQSGTGSTVLYFAQDSTKVKVKYTPSDATDSFSARVFTVSDDTQVFGDTAPISESFDAHFPGLIAISTNGSWTVTPTK